MHYAYAYHVRAFAGLVNEIGTNLPDAGFYDVIQAIGFAAGLNAGDGRNLIHVFDGAGKTVGVVNRTTGGFQTFSQYMGRQK